MSEPKSLQEAILYFSNPDNCLNYLVARRWPNGVVCPTCGSAKVNFNTSRRIWQCGSHHAKRQFSVKVGTIFEDSPIGLDKWLAATWMLTNCKNGISSYDVGRALRVTQKSAWFMMHRVRLALHDESFGEKLRGEVEAGTGTKDKTAVMGFLERGGKVRTMVVPNRRKHALLVDVKKHVDGGAALFTDALQSYSGLDAHYAHQVIDHATAYVDGKIHTNGLENFWSLLKRGIGGTYVSVEPFHLFRYLDEQSFRYNNRDLATDGDRFSAVVSHIIGKRLTWNRLTGKLDAEKRLVN